MFGCASFYLSMNVQAREAPRLGYDPKLPPPVSCWPTKEQTLLLKACLAGPELARKAFADWHGRVNIFKLDHGSNRLMALLYRNLERAGVRAPEHEVLKGNWRYHWYLNKTRWREFGELGKQFEAAGLPMLALKGVSLAPFVYQDLGTRPMADFDLLVPKARAREAADFLRGAGYRTVTKNIEQKFAEANGVEFYRDGSSCVDLHWHVLHDALVDWSDEEFWARSETRVFEGVEARTLGPEDHFLHACAHGMRYNPVPPLRWLADATLLLEREGARMDVDYLMRAAERRRLADPVRRTLDWIARHLDLPAGNPVLAARRGVRVSVYEKVEYPFRVFPDKGLPGFVPQWRAYSRNRLLGDPKAGKGGFLRVYATSKGIGSRAGAGLNIGVMAVKRLVPWLARRARDACRRT